MFSIENSMMEVSKDQTYSIKGKMGDFKEQISQQITARFLLISFDLYWNVLVSGLESKSCV